jgi:hypothetical protein
MCFEPALLQRYKKVKTDLYKPPGSRKENHGYLWIEVGSELSDKLQAYLLDPRFRVEGYLLGDYEPTVIPRALLEGMHPVIETSELVERGIRETFRKFENVRVFDQAADKKASGGRKPTYDWPAVHDKLKREKPHLPNEAELVKWCQANFETVPGKRASKDGPSDKTVRAAILKYGLGKFITPPE